MSAMLFLMFIKNGAFYSLIIILTFWMLVLLVFILYSAEFLSSLHFFPTAKL